MFQDLFEQFTKVDFLNRCFGNECGKHIYRSVQLVLVFKCSSEIEEIHKLTLSVCVVLLKNQKKNRWMPGPILQLTKVEHFACSLDS